VAARSAPPKRAATSAAEIALSVTGLSKSFGNHIAVDDADLTVSAGSFFGFVGPNGAGKTTTLAMVAGLLRPDSGVVTIYGVDIWSNAAVAKRLLGVLPDRLRLFDRLTGSEFLHHAGALRGLDRQTIVSRVADLQRAFGLEHSAKRLVSDYSAGMVKKIAIAAAMIHSPRLLVLDEPFESVDPVSAEVVIDILTKFTAAGGTVILSSHSMDLIERVCDSVAIIADGRMLASGPLDEVLAGKSLEERFVELAGGATAVEGMEWLQSFSD
jgi:ABC-2 type transport system ATP-binding protein